MMQFAVLIVSVDNALSSIDYYTVVTNKTPGYAFQLVSLQTK